MDRQYLRRVVRPVVLYLAGAWAWIVVSDLLLYRALAPDSPLWPFANVAKGLLFVTVTGLLLFRAMASALGWVQQASRRVQALNEGLRTLARVQQLLVQEEDPRRLARQLCAVLVDGREVKAAWMAGLEEPSREMRPWGSALHGREPNEDPWTRELPAQALRRAPAAPALEYARPVVEALASLPAHDPQRELAGHGARWAAAFPLVYQGRVLGVLTLYAARRELFEGDRLELVRELADAVALGLHLASLERARRESEHLVRLQLIRADALRDRDPLTGLYNRQRFEQLLAEEVDASRRRGATLAVMVLDLDRFAEVNVRFGHAAGDRVLRTVAMRMQHALHPAERIGRVGGDAFAAVLPGMGLRQAYSLAREVLRQVSGSPVEVEGRSIAVKATVGVAAYPDHGRSGADLLNALDTALLRARAQQVPLAVFDPASHSMRLEEYGRSEELRRALAEGRIVPALQPVVELASGKVYGYEVLSRIVGEGGVLEAAQFIPQAEAHGLMGELEARMLQHVVALWAWGRFADRRIFVNVALNLLSDESYRELILGVLQRHPEMGRQLVLELTERHSMPKGEEVLAFMEALKARGVQVALDDFGSGYSSIGYFRRIPIDYVKIDGSLVRGVARSELDERVVAAVRRVATELGAEAVAEWVEDAATARRLQQLGVRLGQGYYLGQPVLVNERLGRAS